MANFNVRRKKFPGRISIQVQFIKISLYLRFNRTRTYNSQAVINNDNDWFKRLIRFTMRFPMKYDIIYIWCVMHSLLIVKNYVWYGEDKPVPLSKRPEIMLVALCKYNLKWSKFFDC